MLFAVFLAVFLPCAGMSVVLIVYCCMLWYAATYPDDAGDDPAAEDPVKDNQPSGLSPTQLQKLPSVTGKDLVLGEDCAVCLDVIGADEPARLVPGCNHGFHVECADTWLARHPACPVCRNWLGPELFDPPETNPC